MLTGEPLMVAHDVSSDEITSRPCTPSSVDSKDSWQADSKHRKPRRSTQRLSISDLSDSERMTPERLAERGLGFPWQQEAFCTVELAPESTDRDFCLVPTPELIKKFRSEGSPSPRADLSPTVLQERLAACAVQERLTPQSSDHPWDQPALCTLDVVPEMTDGRDFCLVPTPELGQKPPCDDSPSSGDSISPTALQQRFAACAREAASARSEVYMHLPNSMDSEAPPPHKRQRARTRRTRAGGA